MKKTHILLSVACLGLSLLVQPAFAQSSNKPGKDIDKKSLPKPEMTPGTATPSPQTEEKKPEKKQPQMKPAPETNKPESNKPETNKPEPKKPEMKEKEEDHHPDGEHHHDKDNHPGHGNGHGHGQAKAKTHGPPAWAPAHGYRRRFVYFPKYETYYDNEKKVYVEKDPKNPKVWKEEENVPEKLKNVDLKKEVKVEVENEVQKVNEIHEEIKKKYPVNYQPAAPKMN
ncbi:MAG: hypothetical protein H6585_14740 [Flavobacteriales bacterium]|nr:hypothetical protein [Flavobacteriales bacterium]MCB9449587.1 hypothetical protein [Flavobacteriales bacterium]